MNWLRWENDRIDDLQEEINDRRHKLENTSDYRYKSKMEEEENIRKLEERLRWERFGRP